MKQNKVSVFKDKDIEVFLDNRTDDELATVDLTVENGSDKGVVLGISKLKIDGITHEIYPMEQKSNLTDFLSRYALQEDVADENETYESLKNAMNDNISTIFTEAPYSDEMTEDTYFYHYKMKKEHERPYSTSGKGEFILNVYTTKNGSSSYATQNDDGEFDKLKGIGEVKISVPAIE